MRKTVLALLTATLALASNAFAENFPSRPITVVVPFAAGGPSDAMMRILGERMRAALGQAVLVENTTWRRRLDRRRPRRARGAGRLYGRLRSPRHPRRQRRDLQTRLRSRVRSRTGRAAAEQPDDHRQQERRSGEIAR